MKKTSLLLSILSLISMDAFAWPTSGEMTFYVPGPLQSRCLVLKERYKPDERFFSCENFANEDKFSFLEPIGYLMVTLSFNGNKVKGTWISDMTRIGNEFIYEQKIGNQVFVTKQDNGGKIDDGKIVGGRIVDGVIYALANSQGHGDGKTFAKITIRKDSSGIKWDITGKSLIPFTAYLPEHEVLQEDRDTVVNFGW